MTEYCHHIGMFTNRPQQLLSFYKDKLGFRDAGSKEVGRELMQKIFGYPGECLLSRLERGRAVVEIFHAAGAVFNPPAPPAAALNHWSLAVEDKSAFLISLGDKKVAPIVVSGKGKDIVFIRDPDGNLLEIKEAPEA